MKAVWIVLSGIIGAILATVLVIVLWIVLRGIGMYLVAVCKRPLKKYIEEIRARENFVLLDDISPFFLESIVASEDFRFFEHKGFSTVAMRKAFVLNVKKRRIITGGSGITQQLAKNLYFSFRRLYARKLAELLVGARLEKNYTKLELLELYVNIIEYGPDCYGIENAAQHYYGHSAKALSLWEAVTLASVLPAPRRFNPQANETIAMKRAGDLLEQVAKLAKMPVGHYCRLWEQGCLTTEEEAAYQKASADRLKEYVQGTQKVSVNRKARTKDVFMIEMMKRYYVRAVGNGKRFVMAERLSKEPGDGYFSEEEVLRIFGYLYKRGFRIGGTLNNHRDAAWHPLPIRFAFYGERTERSASAVLERFAESHKEFVINDAVLYEHCQIDTEEPGDLLVTPELIKAKEHRYMTRYFPPYAVLGQGEERQCTAQGLVKYVKRMFSQTTRYLFGTMGVYITPERVEAKRSQYPEWYTEERITQEGRFYSYAGFVGLDCSGLIKSYYFGGIGLPDYTCERDFNSQGLLEHAEKKGPMNTLPELPGVCLYMKEHVGIYIGKGKVIECTCSDVFGNGVVMTKIGDRPWEQWFYCPFVSYEQDGRKRKNK